MHAVPCCALQTCHRTEYPEWAIPCLQQFPIPGHPRGLTLYDVGMFQEIYPGSKLKHFKVIHQVSTAAAAVAAAAAAAVVCFLLLLPLLLLLAAG